MPSTPPLNMMLLGAIAVGSLIAGLLFLRYWRSSRDRFFLFLAASFLIEAANRVYMGVAGTWNEDTPTHYLVRLLSYGLILWAVWDKNRPTGR